MTVRISVIGGYAFVDQVPPGVTVEVTDYDVDVDLSELDASGHPCKRYRVEAKGDPNQIEAFSRDMIEAQFNDLFDAGRVAA